MTVARVVHTHQVPDAGSDTVIDLWYKNAIIYCLDVGTFADGYGDGVGDFRGLGDHLPYLAGIGVTCLWLLPFYPSPLRDHGYDIADFYGVHPRYGTLGDFVNFIRQADELGIRVIVDLVVNHTSDQHPWFKSARSDPDSPHRDWYVWSKRKPPDAESGIVFPGVQKTTWTYDRQARAYYFHRLGEDLRLREREAIRTPMQWSSEANGGFSSAPASKLIRPVIERGEYRYERVNVAAQRLDNESLLNWTERAIRTRKECPEFGWGAMQFLKTDNPSVLAHACTWRGRTVIAIHNFSRAACSVNIKWPKETRVLLHLFGRGVHEPQPASSSVIDLDGYDYRWLRVRTND